MVRMCVYVEGGGDRAERRAACRKGFSRFIEKVGLQGRMPSIVACGSRDNAYDRFKTAHRQGGGTAILLVDAEEPVQQAHGPWRHLETRDRWQRPDAATEDQCHLMVQVMESWFLADKDALESHYGPDFQRQTLPANPNIEQVPKQDVLDSLKRATRNTVKGNYSKGKHSFEILERLDPVKVRRASPFARRFTEALRRG